jgi:hypothetical protein
MVTCRTFGHDELDVEDGGERKKPEKNFRGVCWKEAWLASKPSSIAMQRF